MFWRKTTEFVADALAALSGLILAAPVAMILAAPFVASF